MKLEEIIFKNRYLHDALLFLKDYTGEKIYICAGAVAQSVWNHIFGNDIHYGIDDLDLCYFNDADPSEDAETGTIKDISHYLNNIPIALDIKNQARIHAWYKKKFGYEIPPVTSMTDAIDRFPTTATAIGIRLDDSNTLDVYSSFGLDDLFSGIIRANTRQITRSIYNDKVAKWIKKWPQLEVVPWD